jgi:hypothetical protein
LPVRTAWAMAAAPWSSNSVMSLSPVAVFLA